MGGGEDSLSDAELARMIYELERSSLSERDFERRLSELVSAQSQVQEPALPQPVNPLMNSLSMSNLNLYVKFIVLLR